MNENLEKIMTMKGDWHKKEEEMWNYKSFFFFFLFDKSEITRVGNIL